MKRKTLTGLALAAMLLASCGGSQKNISTGERIKADQIGYKVNSPKIAIVPDSTDDEFEIWDLAQNKLVYRGHTSESTIWEYSGTRVKKADFSDFDTEGIFVMKCKGASDSYPFAIGNSIYNDLSYRAVKSYYFARASQEITSKHGGLYARPSAHPDTVVKIHSSAAGPVRKEGDIISSPGGWYDAGDYNKYIVNSSISVWEILNAVELYPEYSMKLKCFIPESDNNLPDVVDELLYNLRWMITMQDPDDGGVYHKLTALGFNGMIMPHEDHDERYVIQKSTAASLDLAATCAKAARVLNRYQKDLPGLTDSLMNVAVKAWDWAQKNPNVLYEKNPEGVFTGTYNDSHISDELTWAALEMYLATSNDKYLKAIKNDDFEICVPSWGAVGALGVISVMNSPSNENLFAPELYKFMKDGLMQVADTCVKKYQESAYATPLTYFPWGSNSVAANQGLVLITAYRNTGNLNYLEAAQADLHYILGRNPLDYCYVTGMGFNPIKRPHDRRSVADGVDKPVPGLLCGGPFEHAHGDVPDSLYKSTYPAMRYVDAHESFTTNEIAINWNSALVFLSFAIDCER
ncbi:MAG: glycoside hydrolase family 9 protein [Bacteroidales bacterium]|nr:glycoside hydrolase family 9 protein [Bacteroidales bacterium]